MSDKPDDAVPTERHPEGGISVPGHPPASDPLLEKLKPIVRKAWRALRSRGWKWATFKLAAVTLSLLAIVTKLLVLPVILSIVVTDVAERYRIDLTVGDWSADLFDLRGTAHHVTVVAPGAYAEQQLLSAEAIEFDLSLWSRVSGDRWLRQVRVRKPSIHLERLLSGRWNWQDLGDVRLEPEVVANLPSASPGRDFVLASSGVPRELIEVEDTTDSESTPVIPGQFVIPRLVVEGMALRWVENLPAESGGGLIRDLQATLHLDDVTVTASDLRGLVDSGMRPNELSLEARTGDGKISFTGEGNLFYWSQAPQSAEGDAFTAFVVPLWNPFMKADLYLENVGAAAFARLTPDAAIVPVTGSMTGMVTFEVASGQVDCVADLALQDVRFAANEKSAFLRRGHEDVRAQLADYRANGRYTFPCGGVLGPAEEGQGGGYRPFQAFQTNVVRHGLSDAPRRVRALAAIDHARYSEEPIQPELQGEVNRIAGGVDPEVLQWLQLASEIDRVAPAGPRGLSASPRGAGSILDRMRGGFRRP